MNLKRTAVALLCIVLFFVSGAVPKAFADWYDDIESGSWVKIVGQNFVADTFCGVNAYYNETGNSVYHCGELVERFYREAYGLDVEIRTSEPRLRMNTSGYKLVTPDFPKAGDVVFVSAEMRGSYDHWAIVKYYSNGYLVLFEQNVIYNGCAGVERKLKYPSDSYVMFTPVSDGEKSDPVLSGASKNPDEPESDSTEKTEPKQTTETETVTSKPTTTTKPTTTKPTTTKSTTAKPTTTKPTTTLKPTTATKPVTTVRMTTTAAETTTVTATVEETTAQFITYTTEKQTETYVYSTVGTTAEELEKEETKNKATLPLASVCGVSASGVAVLAVLIKKKNNEE